jgi:hypothetical protein
VAVKWGENALFSPLKFNLCVKKMGLFSLRGVILAVNLPKKARFHRQ